MRLAREARPIPTSRILRFFLECAPVRYVVIQNDRIPETRRHLEAAMHRYREKMPLRSRIGNDAVCEIVTEPEIEPEIEIEAPP